MTSIGILSDTHINHLEPWFIRQVHEAFRDCPIILHAGDLVDLSVLDAFTGKEVHAVHGNMCKSPVREALPHAKLIEIDGFRIGLCHGAGIRETVEERMWDLFPEAHCIVYGHTHIPVNHSLGQTLFINPGSFTASSRHGAPGSYAILHTTKGNLHGTLYQFATSNR